MLTCICHAGLQATAPMTVDGIIYKLDRTVNCRHWTASRTGVTSEGAAGMQLTLQTSLAFWLQPCTLVRDSVVHFLSPSTDRLSV